MSAAVELVQDLRARGITLRADGELLRYRPASALSAEDVDRLRAAKTEVLALLRAGAALASDCARPMSSPVDLLNLPLDRFAAEGQPLEVRVPWWPSTHFFVPALRDVEALTRNGIGRERIWLPVELAELVDAGASVAELRGRTVVRLVVRAFGGEVTDVHTPPRWPELERPAGE